MQKEDAFVILAEPTWLRLGTHPHDHPPPRTTKQSGSVLPKETVCRVVKEAWCLRGAGWSWGPSYQEGSLTVHMGDPASSWSRQSHGLPMLGHSGQLWNSAHLKQQSLPASISR